MKEQSIMADQRPFGNPDRPSTEVGAQARDRVQEAGGQARERAQEAGAQVRDKAQEAGAQVRESAQEAGAQVRDKAQEMGQHGQEMVRQGAETAAAYYQQGRQQGQAVEHTLEEAIRAKPLQSILMAAGLGMFVTLLWKHEDPAAAYSRNGRQRGGDHNGRGR